MTTAISERSSHSGLLAQDCRLVISTATDLRARHEHVPGADLVRVEACMRMSSASGTRMALARAFVELIEPDELANEVVRLVRRTREPEVISEAFWALADLGEAGRPALVRLCREEDAVLRWHAYQALARDAREDSISLLIEGLADTEVGVRWTAARALAGLGEPVRWPLLRALVTHEPSRRFHRAARSVLSRLLSPDNPDARALLESLGRSTTVFDSGVIAYRLLRDRPKPVASEARPV